MPLKNNFDTEVDVLMKNLFPEKEDLLVKLKKELLAYINTNIQLLSDSIEDIKNDLTNIELTPGSQGEIGPQGVKGEKGQQGSVGLTGLMGLRGEQGIQGKDGRVGKSGFDGRDGQDGQDGKNGVSPIIDYQKIVDLVVRMLETGEIKIPQKRQLQARSFGGGSANWIDEIPSGVINGVNTTFTTTTDIVTNSEILRIGGSVMEKTVDYTFSVRTITMTVAPVQGERIRIKYQRS